MRRLYYLKDNLYHKKYRKIYKLVFTADLDTISDDSNWYKPDNPYTLDNDALLIICTSSIINKRIWITKQFGTFKIITATLNLDVNSQEYRDSIVHKEFKNQTEQSIYLKELLQPCLEHIA